MAAPRRFVDAHSPAPVFRQAVVPLVLPRHSLEGEVAPLVLEPGRVHRDELGVHAVLDLLLPRVQVVAVDEAATLGRVGVEVEVEAEIRRVLLEEVLDGVDGRVSESVGLVVEAVQIAPAAVAPVVPPGDAVRVEHGDHLEHVPEERKRNRTRERERTGRESQRKLERGKENQVSDQLEDRRRSLFGRTSLS